MIHADGTMDVMCNGKIERRRYTVVGELGSVAKLPLCGRPDKFEPELREGEQVQYFHSSPIPHIITMHWPRVEDCRALSEAAL